MKKTFFAALFTLSISLSFANVPVLQTFPEKKSDIVNATKPIDITLRSANGSAVHLVGSVTFSLNPANITSFSGTVTIASRTGGLNGTMAFSNTGKLMNMVFDNQDVKKLKTIKWVSTAMNAAYSAILNETGINNSLVALFRTFG